MRVRDVNMDLVVAGSVFYLLLRLAYLCERESGCSEMSGEL